MQFTLAPGHLPFHWPAPQPLSSLPLITPSSHTHLAFSGVPSLLVCLQLIPQVLQLTQGLCCRLLNNYQARLEGSSLLA